MTFTDAVRVRVIRAILGWSSKAFAESIGVSAGTLTAWEKGRTSPQGSRRDALAELCRQHSIGFTPTGYPLPWADCMSFRSKEDTNVT